MSSVLKGNDADGDGLGNYQEECVIGTSQTRADTDRDLVDDYTELYIGSNPLAYNSDGDAAFDGCEYQYLMNGANVDPAATDPDSDNDTIPDGLELYTGLNPGNQDSDQDMRFDNEEWNFCYISGKSGVWSTAAIALDPDYDDDGIQDGIEEKSLGTKWYMPDSDEDGWGDYGEVYIWGTDPTDPNDHPDPAQYPPDHP